MNTQKITLTPYDALCALLCALIGVLVLVYNPSSLIVRFVCVILFTVALSAIFGYLLTLPYSIAHKLASIAPTLFYRVKRYYCSLKSNSSQTEILAKYANSLPAGNHSVHKVQRLHKLLNSSLPSIATSTSEQLQTKEIYTMAKETVSITQKSEQGKKYTLAHALQAIDVTIKYAENDVAQAMAQELLSSINPANYGYFTSPVSFLGSQLLWQLSVIAGKDKPFGFAPLAFSVETRNELLPLLRDLLNNPSVDVDDKYNYCWMLAKYAPIGLVSEIKAILANYWDNDTFSSFEYPVNTVIINPANEQLVKENEQLKAQLAQQSQEFATMQAQIAQLTAMMQAQAQPQAQPQTVAPTVAHPPTKLPTSKTPKTQPQTVDIAKLPSQKMQEFVLQSAQPSPVTLTPEQTKAMLTSGKRVKGSKIPPK